MSLIQIDADSTISTIVEAMLPRFSDSTLGLLIGVDLSWYDYGYGKDGNTKERDETYLRSNVWFLFVRPSNYTKVYVYEERFTEDGTTGNPKYEELVWEQSCDHDSCWRTDGMRYLNEVYNQAYDFFKERGVELRNVHTHHGIGPMCSEPLYVRLDKREAVHPHADSFSPDSRIFKIKCVPIDMVELRRYSYIDKGMNGNDQTFYTGLQILGSVDNLRYHHHRTAALDCPDPHKWFCGKDCPHLKACSEKAKQL